MLIIFDLDTRRGKGSVVLSNTRGLVLNTHKVKVVFLIKLCCSDVCCQASVTPGVKYLVEVKR